jgi:hypothetical protein
MDMEKPNHKRAANIDVSWSDVGIVLLGAISGAIYVSRLAAGFAWFH